MLKSYRHPESNTWRREAAGLVAAAGSASPELLAVVEDPALVLMSDLGRGASLAELLLARDPAAAGAGLHAWARALADLHAKTAARVETFGSDLGEELPVSLMTDEIGSLSQNLTTVADQHHLPALPDLDGLVGQVAESLGDRENWVVSPGDTCPDNNLLGDGVAHLLDFEWAEARHPAWDAAYLRVPWPTCWCAWQVPRERADAALATYRATVSMALPWVAEPRFGADVDAATLLWCLSSSVMFLPGALDAEADNADTARRPGRRTMILSRLELASHLPGPPELTAYAGRVATELTRRWGPHPLALAPAFA